MSSVMSLHISIQIVTAVGVTMTPIK